MRIQLGAKTRKAKNRLSQFGSTWVCLEERASVPCLGGDTGMMIEPVTGDESGRRWIRMPIDHDFELLEVTR